MYWASATITNGAAMPAVMTSGMALSNTHQSRARTMIAVSPHELLKVSQWHTRASHRMR